MNSTFFIIMGFYIVLVGFGVMLGAYQSNLIEFVSPLAGAVVGGIIGLIGSILLWVTKGRAMAYENQTPSAPSSYTSQM
jgi:cytochrome c biogenesis protein CcdA